MMGFPCTAPLSSPIRPDKLLIASSITVFMGFSSTFTVTICSFPCTLNYIIRKRHFCHLLKNVIILMHVFFVMNTSFPFFIMLGFNVRNYQRLRFLRILDSIFLNNFYFYSPRNWIWSIR